MANTNVKTARVPKAPKAPRPTTEEVDLIPEVVEIEQPEEVKEVVPENRTEIHLVQKGEKYNVYRDTKKLTRKPVSLEKARLIASGYGESNPTVQ